MAKLETGKWPAVDSKGIIANVELVLRTGDITHLSKKAYEFITLNMGFIAHYNLMGFQCEYGDTREFANRLQTSEYSQDPNYNLNWADSKEHDSQFNKWYGFAYCKSCADAIRGIVYAAQRITNQLSFKM